MTQFDETTLREEGFAEVNFRLPVWTCAPGAKLRGYVLDQRRNDHGPFFVVQLTRECEARDLLGHEGAPLAPRHVVVVYSRPELAVLRAFRVAYENARLDAKTIRVPTAAYEVAIMVDADGAPAIQSRRMTATEAHAEGQPIVQQPPDWVEAMAPPWQPDPEGHDDIADELDDLTRPGTA